ncbi:uncharacterized protein LOC133032052 [Cannabis sativa]|uniref:uncharacterized protein LOC133032052 n=1 Tax=Cannabis sativa TaxID=3483 RepID=UPI0029CA1898|nr:uncharacterized protein LOC133032052 [Cannabis sativa]
MRGVAWNCRGLRQTSTVRELKSLIRSHSPDFIFLTELKVNTTSLVRTLNSLHFYFNILVPAVGSVGGIILSWKVDFVFECVACSKNHISGLVYSDPPTHPWLLSCVYGPPYSNAQKAFWEEFMNLGDRFGGSWLILGDTNFVLSESERADSKGRDPFIPFISNLVNSRGLINMPIYGDKLTWDNHWSGQNHVKFALDKGLTSFILSSGQEEKFKRSFKFEAGWTRDERSKLVVDYAWKSVIHSWAPARIFKKMGATRVALLHWNRSQFGKVDILIKELEKKLDRIQRLPAGMRVWDTECAIRRSLNEAWERNELYWKQRAKVSWLKEGDKCSKFFFLSAAIKGRQNAIDSILNKDDIWISRRDLIGNEFIDFFKGIFSGTSVGNDFNSNYLIKDRISIADQADLVHSPTHEEICSTLFSMSNNKAPRPDGMSVLFFKHYWETVGMDFCDAVSDFFRTGRMHKGVNAMNIVLIPKVQNPKRTNHYRHISLCNVMYKVISKIIANRVKPLLPSLICPTQAAFVPGRNIQGNNVIIQEIIHSFNRKKGKEGFFAIKIDLMKAYDKLSWNFIDLMLAGFGAPQKFRGRISQCITTNSLNIFINGGQFGKIIPSCGLRQGDPLSPYLFICAAKILSRLLIDALDNGSIKGIKLSRGGLGIKPNTNMEEVKGYWHCLERFCAWSGQQVNKLKTSICFSKNTSNGMKRGIKEALGLSSLEGNIKYLGLPLFRSRQNDADFNFILDNLTSKLQGWKAKILSKAGRATLIKSMGLSLPMYAMQTTKLSNRLVAQIDGLVRDFWWGFEKGNHGLHLKAWDKLCLPKSLRAHKKDFCPRANGSSTCEVDKVAELLIDNGGWNIQKLNSLFDKETISAILKGGNPSGQGDDRWIWTLENNGKFTSKSAYLAQAVDRAPTCDVAPSLWNKLWNCKITERMKTLWWCLLANAIPVRAEICKRFPIEDVTCPLCGTENESIEHLFLSCNVAFHLWRSFPWGIYPVCGTGIRLWDWVKFIWDLKNKGINADEVFLYASLTVDTIWRTRNEKVHHASLIPCAPPHRLDAWCPPPQDWLKLNCDVKVGLDSMCSVVVARDHLSGVIWVHTSKLDSLMLYVGKQRLAVLLWMSRSLMELSLLLLRVTRGK